MQTDKHGANRPEDLTELMAEIAAKEFDPVMTTATVFKTSTEDNGPVFAVISQGTAKITTATWGDKATLVADLQACGLIPLDDR